MVDNQKNECPAYHRGKCRPSKLVSEKNLALGSPPEPSHLGIIVNASDELEAGVSGSGSVEYAGDPAVEQNVSGAGEVRKQ